VRLLILIAWGQTMTAYFVDLGDADGSIGFDASDPDSPWVLVPEGKHVKLYLRGADPSWHLHVDDPSVLGAWFEQGHGLSPNASDEQVVLHGLADGEAVLSVRNSHGHRMAHLRVMVARQLTLFVKFFFVKDATGQLPKIWSPAFAKRALSRVDSLYRHQVNLTCQYFGEQYIEIPDVNFATVSPDDDAADAATARIWKRLDDFSDDAPAKIFYYVYCVHAWGVRDVGRAVVGTNRPHGNLCVIEDFINNSNHAMVLAHEMGHFLGQDLDHNNSSTKNLMHEKSGWYGGNVLSEDEIRQIRDAMG
jgi:hypothetical protein